MMDKNTAAHRMMREAIKTTAEAKLGRTLTQAEQHLFLGIPSLLMLEAIERLFSNPQADGDEILRELDRLRRQKSEN